MIPMIIQEEFAYLDHHSTNSEHVIILIASPWDFGTKAGGFTDALRSPSLISFIWCSLNQNYHCYTTADNDIHLFTGGDYNSYPDSQTTSSGIFYNMKEDQSGGGGALKPSSLQCVIIIPRAANIITRSSTSLQEEMPKITTTNYPTSEAKVVSLISSSRIQILTHTFMVLCMK